MSEERLLQRVEKLEQSNRHLKLFGGAALAGLGLLSASSAMCDTVWAERFVLKDEHGKKRIMLDAYHTHPSIAFFDANGQKQIATIALGKNGAPNWTCPGAAHQQHDEAQREGSSSIGN
jgi:hypothetical protein